MNKYRFMLNVTLKNNLAFKELESGLYLNYNHPLGYIEVDSADDINEKIKSAVLFKKIIDLDNALTDITDDFTDDAKACIQSVIKEYDIKDDTFSLEPINAITNGFRDKEPVPKNNTGVYEYDLVPKLKK